MSVRVLIVDDHAVVRSGLRRLLEAEEDIEVVGEAGAIREAVFETRAKKPDVILLDVVLPGESGIEGAPNGFAQRRRVDDAHVSVCGELPIRTARIDGRCETARSR